MTPAKLPLKITRGLTFFKIVIICYKDAARVVTDAVTTTGSPTLTSATAAFAAGDVGKVVSGAGIPVGTTILGRTNSTTVTLSANATATATDVALTIDAGLADITGYVPLAQVRKHLKSSDVAYDLAPTVTNGPAGEITIPEISETSTLNFAVPDGVYRWDLVLQTPDGKRLGPFLADTFEVCTEVVTRPPG